MVNPVKIRMMRKTLSTMIKSLEDMERVCRKMADIEDMYTLSELDAATEKILEVELKMGVIKDDFDELLNHCVVKRMGLSSRTVNSLLRAGYEIDDVYSLTLDDLSKIRGIGKKAIDEIIRFKEENS